MLRDKSVRRNAIAVGENDVVGTGGRHRFVADSGSTKAVVLLPYVAYGEWRTFGEVFNDPSGIRSGTIVGYDQLEALVALGGEPGKHRRQRVGAIIGSHDNRYIGHRRPSIHALR